MKDKNLLEVNRSSYCEGYQAMGVGNTAWCESAKCIGKRDYEVIAASPNYTEKGLAVAVGDYSESHVSVCESIPSKAEGIPVMAIGDTSIAACPRYYEEKYQAMVSGNCNNTEELNYGIAYGRSY